MKVVIPKRLWRYPMAAERGYSAWIKKYVKSLTGSLKDNIGFIQSFINNQSRQDDAVDDYREEMKNAIAAAIAGGIAYEVMRRKLESIYNEIDNYNRSQLEAVYASIGQVPVVRADTSLLRKQYMQRNEMLLNDIKDKVIQGVSYEIDNQVTSGYDETKLAKAISQVEGVQCRRADKIAHNEVGNLDGRLCQERQLANGVTKYQWRTVLDERVRPWHADREGKIYSWNNPPWDGHPRQAPFCRCEACPCIPWDNLLSISNGRRNIVGADIIDV